jgi:two-component system, NarL family, sensor kinase
VIAWTGAVLAPPAVLTAYWMAAQVPWDAQLDGVDPIGLMFPAAGAFLISRRPRQPFPWIMWWVGVIWAVYILLFASVHWMTAFAPNPYIPYVAWPAAWLWLWVVPAFAGIMPLLFPDGRLPSRRWRPVLYGNLGLMVGHSLMLGLTPDPSFELGLPMVNPFGIAALGDLPEVVESWITPPMIALSLLGLVSLGFRYKVATPRLRRQIAWYFCTMTVFLLFWLFRPVGEPVAETVHLMLAAGIPLSVIAAVLRHRLYGIEVILNRTLVYGALALLVGVTYSGLIWAGHTLTGDYGPLAGLAAAMAAGAVFHPLRLRLQGAVDRLFDVERDPYRTADRLSRTVQEAGDPAEALATATSLVRWALGARGAGVEVRGERTLTFVDGDLGRRPREIPLAWHGEPVGRLLLAGARAGREPLSVLAKHLAELAHAVRLTGDLIR